jgi:hypothetical protein
MHAYSTYLLPGVAPSAVLPQKGQLQLPAPWPRWAASQRLVQGAQLRVLEAQAWPAWAAAWQLAGHLVEAWDRVLAAWGLAQQAWAAYQAAWAAC